MTEEKKVELTGSEVIVEYLIKEGLPYVFGIPGHGCLGLTDALYKYQDKIKVIQPKQELAGVHMAVGYYRVTGQPLAVFTSIGPGAINTAIGLADAFVDSMPVLVITGDTHVHMKGAGVLQEIERQKDSSLPKILEPVVKRSFELTSADQVPKVIQRSFNIMLTGRKGPVHINLPMDIQCDYVKGNVPIPEKRRSASKIRGDIDHIKLAAEMLMSAKRPVLWLGGGVVASKAFEEVKEIAEFAGAPVLTSMMAKDAFPNDHPLFGWATGSKGTKIGIQLSSKADVVLAIGTRFADGSTSSYRKGIAWNFGNGEKDTRLIHVDIDPNEIGKNYPTDVGIVGDAKSVLSDMLDVLRYHFTPVNYLSSFYFNEIHQLKEEWIKFVNDWRIPSLEPVMISCVLKEVREFLKRDAIVVTSSGNVQAQLIQEFEFYEPYTCITAGGFSTMGFTLPAAIGAKLGQPNKQVIGLVGDGDFMMTMQELHTAKQLNLNVVIVILNNAGWIAITDLQRTVYGEERGYATEFKDHKGGSYTPDFAAIAKGFGCWARKITKAEEIQPALDAAFKQEGPAIIEIMVNRDPKYTGSPAWGWWDVPIPAYMKDKREKYLEQRQEETI
ncbi:MAG: thiamine pyrophosphate-binding protein [Candidatus Heimdallarchaeota archaeon]|nr:thiamine pyrophosphate-binding protein [Candidatus Heimdallarchaeota archaeon]